MWSPLRTYCVTPSSEPASISNLFSASLCRTLAEDACVVTVPGIDIVDFPTYHRRIVAAGCCARDTREVPIQAHLAAYPSPTTSSEGELCRRPGSRRSTDTRHRSRCELSCRSHR